MLSFAVVAFFVRRRPQASLGRGRPLVRVDRPAVHALVAGGRGTLLGAFFLLLGAGFFGTEDAYRNIVPTAFWVAWWVGGAMLCTFVGDLWNPLHPLRTLFAPLERLRRRAPRPWPRGLGFGPAIAGLLALAWLELIAPDGESPFALARALAVYALLTGLGVVWFGGEAWLQRGESSAIAFSLLGRFAPLGVETRAARADCPAAPCHAGRLDGACIDGHACSGRAERHLVLRWPSLALLAEEPESRSRTVFVLLLLSLVTFDGLLETPFWQASVDALLLSPLAPALDALGRWSGAGPDAIANTLGLLACPSLFVGLFAACVRAMPWAAGTAPVRPSIGTAFALTLVPISAAYHLAHYLPMLLISGQQLVPLASDPFGFGWNLFGSAGARVDLAIIGARTVWYVAVAAIVTGHLLAVALAHVVAMRLFPDPRAALRSQAPLVLLMIGYTMVSLWILAQPIVE